jgi:hypothetical protein
MYTIIYHKISKKIIFTRNDVTIGDALPALNFILENHCDLNNLNSADYLISESVYNKTLAVQIGNHVFNEATLKAEPDPNYVMPIPPASTESAA